MVAAMEQMDQRFRGTRYAENEKEALLMAVALLEAEGWCQNPGRGENGECCVWVAIGTVVGCYEPGKSLSLGLRASAIWNDASHSLLNEINRGKAGGIYGSVIDWNDEPGRTKGDVVNLLRHVASTL